MYPTPRIALAVGRLVDDVSNVLACQMDGGRGSHSLSAEDTKVEVKRPEAPPTRSQGPEGP